MQGRSVSGALGGASPDKASDMLFLTECTWMRKRGVRTPEWKLIVARDHPDIHGRPPLELYNLRTDPRELRNVAAEQPAVVAALRAELEGWIDRRLRETGLPDPIERQEITLRQIGQPPSPEGAPLAREPE